jgi:L-asparaginase/Glu-tRNA(Gln) amidotransferase subunit D
MREALTSHTPITLEIIVTGGTIDMEGFDSRQPTGRTNSLMKAVEYFAPGVQVHQPLLEPLDSSNIGPAEWKTILTTIISLCDKRIDWLQERLAEGHQPPVPGIVVTHGTDILQETALLFALELAGRGLAFPVILTCAFSPPTETQSDALRNLVLAVTAAMSFRLGDDGEHAIPPGVYVLVGNDLHLASRIKKVTTRPLNNRSYVESYPAPAGQLTIAHKANLWRLDIENEVRLRFHHDTGSSRPEGRMRTHNEIRDLGYVEHLWFKKDSAPEILETALARSHHHAVETGRSTALVIQGDFSNKSEQELRQIIQASRRFRQGGIQVPAFSGSPRVVEQINSHSRYKKLIYLIPKSLSHSKARTKLSWLLQKPLTPGELARMLCRDIAGECFEVSTLPDWIAGESYGPNNHLDNRVAKRVVIVFPGIEPTVYFEAAESLLNSKARDRELCIVGFGDGNIPLSPMTVAGKVEEYVAERYGLQCGFHPPATYLQVEAEIAAFLRYNPSFRHTILSRYEITDSRVMVREVIKWCIQENEKDKALRIERKAEAFMSLLAEGLSINEKMLRGALKRDGVRALLSALDRPSMKSHVLTNIPDRTYARAILTIGDFSC